MLGALLLLALGTLLGFVIAVAVSICSMVDAEEAWWSTFRDEVLSNDRDGWLG